MTAPLRLRWRAVILAAESGLTWHARLLGCVLVEHANNKTAVLDPAPSAATLALEMGASLTSAHAGRRELEAAGLLQIIRRSGRPSRMRLVLPSEPLSVAQGLEGPTPARTPARTPAPYAPEQGEPGEQGPLRGTRDIARAPASAQKLTAYYVDQVRAAGAEPPRRLVGQVAQQLGALAAEGYDEPTLEAALDLMLGRRLNPTLLPGLVVEAQLGPRQQTRAEHPADTALRRALELTQDGDPL